MEAIVFGGVQSLDFPEVRSAVTRIPEVAARIREAQLAWDIVVADDTCLFHKISSDESARYLNREVRLVLAAAVQLGLFDRYLRNNKMPEMLVGDIRNFSAVSVASKTNTFKELVSAICGQGNETDFGVLPVMNGSQLPEYQAFQKRGDSYEASNISGDGLNSILPQLAQEKSIRRLIAVGPGPLSLSKELEYGALSDVICLESIDMDPMLNWFWPSVRSSGASA
jgi:hypothetical protein